MFSHLFRLYHGSASSVALPANGVLAPRARRVARRRTRNHHGARHRAPPSVSLRCVTPWARQMPAPCCYNGHSTHLRHASSTTSLANMRENTMSLRSSVAGASASIARFGLQRVLHRRGGSIPGMIALKLDPDILRELAPLFQSSVVVTGTNGKTTTTNLLADALAANGTCVVTNRAGNNMEAGIAGAILEDRARAKGARDATGPQAVGCFECDELYTARVLPKLKPNYLVLLNLFPRPAGPLRRDRPHPGRHRRRAGLLARHHACLQRGRPPVRLYRAPRGEPHHRLRLRRKRRRRRGARQGLRQPLLRGVQRAAGV